MFLSCVPVLRGKARAKENTSVLFIIFVVYYFFVSEFPVQLNYDVPVPRPSLLFVFQKKLVSKALSLFQFAAGVLPSLGGVGTGVDKGTSQIAADGLG